MDTLITGTPVTLRAGSSIDLSQISTPLTVVSGAVAVGSLNGRTCQFVATPGDLLAIERLLAVPLTVSATALTEVSLAPADGTSSEHLIVSALLQSRRQCGEMDRLRTGPIAVRVQFLIDLLRRATSRDLCDPPRLHHAAAVVECTPETVCRLFTSLRFRAPAPSGRHASRRANSKRSDVSSIHASTGNFVNEALAVAA